VLFVCQLINLCMRFYL